MRGTPVDLRGRRFGRLVAVAPTTERRGGQVMWHCECECGGFVKVRSNALIGGNTRSCGCRAHDARRRNPDPRWGYGQ
jgi:hypothetical protein